MRLSAFRESLAEAGLGLRGAGVREYGRAFRVDAAEVVVSGGGGHNPQIMAHLAAFLPGVTVATSAQYGIDPDAKKAIAFAVLAYQTWHRRPSNLPSATGARHLAILGHITP